MGNSQSKRKQGYNILLDEGETVKKNNKHIRVDYIKSPNSKYLTAIGNKYCGFSGESQYYNSFKGPKKMIDAYDLTFEQFKILVRKIETE